MIRFVSVALLSLLSLLFPLNIAAHGPMNNLVSTIGATAQPPAATTLPSVDSPLFCPVLDYAVKVNYDASLNSLSIYFLSLNNTFNTVFTDVHLQSPFESNIRMSRENNQSVAAFESLSGSIADPTDMSKTGTGERFPTAGRSVADRQSAYSAAQSQGSVLQLFNATIPNVKLFNDSTVRVWFTYCLNSGLIDCNTEIFVWRPSPTPSSESSEGNTNIITSPPAPTPSVISPPSSKIPLTCPALNFTHKLIKEASTTVPGGYAYKIVFINLDSPDILADLVDVHYKISSPARSLSAQDWINIRMKPVTPHRPLSAIEQYSWTTASIIDIRLTGAGGIQSLPNLQYRQEKELLARQNNIPLQMFEVGGISLNLGDQLNFWFTYCLNMQIDCNTEEYLFNIPTSLPKKEQLFQSSSPQVPVRSSVNQNINPQDFHLLNRPLQQNIPNENLMRAAPLTNAIRTAPVLIPSIRTLPIATVPNNPNLNNNFNLHRSTSISAANAAGASISSAAAADPSINAPTNQLFHVHSDAQQLSAAPQPHIRTVYDYEIDSSYGHGSHYYYNPHTIRYYVIHDEL